MKSLKKSFLTNLNVGGDQIKRKTIFSVILLLAFALILNVNASSAATVNGTSSLNSSVKSDLSTNVANPVNSISSKHSESSSNLVSTTEPVTTASKAVTTNTAAVTTTSNAVTTTTPLTTTTNAVSKDITPPKVTKSSPVNNKNIHTAAPNKTIIIKFNEKISRGSGKIVLSNSKGKHVAIKISINGNFLLIKSLKNLINGQIYQVKLNTGSVKDLSGNYLATPYTLKFGVKQKVQPVPAALNPYLKPSAHCQSTNPKIKALEKSITKGSKSKLTSAVKIFNWVRNHINYAFYYNSKKGALGTLSSRSGNCADTANLMVALERAAGIPARYEHINAQFSSGHWYGHVVAQVYVNGKWYYADGTSFRNSFGVIKNWNTKTFKLEGIYRSLPF
jgi:methionine-rich copper-binding protein CopC